MTVTILPKPMAFLLSTFGDFTLSSFAAKNMFLSFFKGSLGFPKHKYCLHLLVASSLMNTHHNHVVLVHQNKHVHTSIHHPLAVLREECL